MIRGLVVTGPRPPTRLQPKLQRWHWRRLRASGGTAGAVGFWVDRRPL